MKIKIFTTSDCGYCIQLKELLDILRIQYIDIDIKIHENEYNEIVKKVNHYYVPIIEMDSTILSPNIDFNSISEASNIIFRKLKSF